MAISLDIDARSAAPPAVVFRTVADLRSWDDFAGVSLLGPARPLVAGDRVEARLRVMRQDIICGCAVRSVSAPTDVRSGVVELRSIDGPFEAVVIGSVASAPGGSDLRVEGDGVGRGAARLLEGPVDYVLQQWARHQLRHLLARAAEENAGTGAGVGAAGKGHLAGVDRL